VLSYDNGVGTWLPHRGGPAIILRGYSERSAARLTHLGLGVASSNPAAPTSIYLGNGSRKKSLGNAPGNTRAVMGAAGNGPK
jgi:hypothetical protein